MENKTAWKPVEYGSVGGEICRISEWTSYCSDLPQGRFTLSPVDFGTPHVGLREGEFERFNEFENEATRKMLGDSLDYAKDDDCETWKD